MGPQFYQTGYGRKFFEADLPRIAKGIERLAAAIEKQNELAEKQTNGKAHRELVNLVAGMIVTEMEGDSQ